MAPLTENTAVNNEANQAPGGPPCYKTGTHNCWPPKATNHTPKPHADKKTKKVSAMMKRWIAQTPVEGPWSALGCLDNAGLAPEAVSDEKKEG